MQYISNSSNVCVRACVLSILHCNIRKEKNSVASYKLSKVGLKIITTLSDIHEILTYFFI